MGCATQPVETKPDRLDGYPAFLLGTFYVRASLALGLIAISGRRRTIKRQPRGNALRRLSVTFCLQSEKISGEVPCRHR